MNRFGSIEDLPDKMRKQVIAKVAADEHRKAGRSRRVASSNALLRCATAGCEYETTVLAAMERHADQNQHNRYMVASLDTATAVALPQDPYTQEEPAMAASDVLGDHEGRPVRRSSLEVRNMAGGLRKALRTDPAIIHAEQKAYVLCEVVGTAHTFKPMDDGEAWERVNITNATTVAVVDEEFARAAIESQQEKNRKLAEEESGQGPLTPEAALAVDHAQGMHKRKKKGCADCYPDPLGVDDPANAVPEADDDGNAAKPSRRKK